MGGGGVGEVAIPVAGMPLQGGTAGPQREGQASPPAAPGCEVGGGGLGGGWALEGRRSPGGHPREEQCPWAKQDGHWSCAGTYIPEGFWP